MTRLRHQLVEYLEEILLALLLATLILLAIMQIGLRLLFDSGMVWIDPLLRYLVVWGGFLGALLGVKRGRHISLDLSEFLFPSRVVRLLAILGDLTGFLVCALLSYAAILFLRDEIAFGAGELLSIPAWAWNLVFPLVFAGMALRYLARALFPKQGADPKTLPGHRAQ